MERKEKELEYNEKIMFYHFSETCGIVESNFYKRESLSLGQQSRQTQHLFTV